MDSQSDPSEDCDPAVIEILERTRRLTTEEVVQLARAYRETVAAGGPTRSRDDRQRAIDLARRRSGIDLRPVETAAAEAIRAAAVGDAQRPLRRLGLIEHAERAVTDAIFAIVLRARLGAAEAAELRRPWETIA
jgi:hypothetical protein